MQADGDTVGEIAAALSLAKATDVATSFPDRLVIGADQILDCAGQMFDKPPTLDDAAGHLRRLQGQTHRLVTAACIVHRGAPIWRVETTANLKMRILNDNEIADYVSSAGPDILGSVGAYRLEGLGANLFERIDGDYFTILGLPLLPLLAVLREHGLTTI